jgi:hypothetical protein
MGNLTDPFSSVESGRSKGGGAIGDALSGLPIHFDDGWMVAHGLTVAAIAGKLGGHVKADPAADADDVAAGVGVRAEMEEYILPVGDVHSLIDGDDEVWSVIFCEGRFDRFGTVACLRLRDLNERAALVGEIGSADPLRVRRTEVRWPFRGSRLRNRTQRGVLLL